MQDRLTNGLLATAVTVFVWWRTSVIDGPFLFHDEFGYVAVSRWLAGPQTPELLGPLYHPGYGLLLTPLAAAVKDPATFHAWATFLNAVTVGFIFAASTALGGRLHLNPAPRMAAAVVACTSSAMVLFSGMLLAEVLLALTCSVAVLAVWRLGEAASNSWGVVAGFAVAAAYLVHPRAIVLLLALVLVGVFTAIAGGHNRAYLVAIGTALVGCAVTYLLNAMVRTEIYAQVNETDTGFLVENAVTNPVLWLKATVGTVWYLTVSTFGLAIWGVVGASRLAFHRSAAASKAALFVTVAVAGSVALSGAFTAGILANPQISRPDIITYGRYVEQWLPVLIVFGVAELVRQVSSNRQRINVWFTTAIAMAGVILVAGPLVFASFGPETRSGPAAISNSSALGWFWFQTGNLDLTRWAWVAAAVVLVAVIGGRFRYWLPLVAMFAWSQLATESTVNDWAVPAAQSWEQRGRVEGADLRSPYVYVPDANPLSIYGLQYWQPELDVDVVIALDD